jgi:hypothetical protein
MLEKQRRVNKEIAERERLGRLGVGPAKPSELKPLELDGDRYSDPHTKFAPQQENLDLCLLEDGRVGMRNWVRLLDTEYDRTFIWFAQISTVGKGSKTLRELPLGCEITRRNETGYALLLDSIKLERGTWRVTVGLRDAWTTGYATATSEVITVP